MGCLCLRGFHVLTHTQGFDHIHTRVNEQTSSIDMVILNLR